MLIIPSIIYAWCMIFLYLFPDSVLKEVETFLTCFCVFTNGAKLLNTNTSEGELLCVHGIRFLSMSWVILGHSYVFGYTQMSKRMTANTYRNSMRSEIPQFSPLETLRIVSLGSLSHRNGTQERKKALKS